MSFYHITHVRSGDELCMRMNDVERRIVLESRGQASRVVLALNRADRDRLRGLLQQADALDGVRELWPAATPQGGGA